MTKLTKYLSILALLVLAIQLGLASPCSAESISPSSKTRTFAAPTEDYLQQVTKGQALRWFDRDMAVRVLIKPGAEVPNFKPQFEKILRDSFQEWQNTTDSKIKFEFVTEAPADITCEFVDVLPKQSESVAGVTSYQTSPYHIDSAMIKIRTTSKITPLTDDLLRSVCLHEIGHAIGLVHHSLDPHDVMSPYLSTQKGLSSRDIKTIRLLYEFRPPEAILQAARKPQLDPNYPHGLILLSSEDYDAYSRKVVGKLLKSFAPFSKGAWLECSVRCLVDSSGNVYNYRIFQSSGNDDFDQKVITSLLSVVPLPPVPEKLRQNQWSKAPIALKFRSDGWVIPYIEPDRQSAWLESIEQPSPDELMHDLEKHRATPKVIDPRLEPWIVAVTQKAQSTWKTVGRGKTEIVLGIRNNGKIAHLVIIQPSGDEAFDNSAINACMAAEPYPVPPNPTQDTTEVNLLFEL